MTADFDQKALQRLTAEIGRDIERGDYDGATIILARHGEIAVSDTLGYAERTINRPLCRDDVFRVLSLSKA